MFQGSGQWLHYAYQTDRRHITAYNHCGRSPERARAESVGARQTREENRSSALLVYNVDTECAEAVSGLFSLIWRMN